MSWSPLTNKQKADIASVYATYPLGRDSLWARVKEKFPNDHISQRSILHEFLNYQTAHQIQQKPPKARSIAPLNIQQRGYIQADLVSMKSYPDNGYTGFFHMIDGFTKKSWGVPLRSESEPETAAALRTCLNKAKSEGATFSICQVDNGSHFQSIFRSVLADFHIKVTYSAPGRPQSNAFVEKRGGDIKRQLFHLMILNHDKKWVSRFQTVIDNINSTKSFATGQTPNELESGNTDAVASAQAEITKNISLRYKVNLTGKPLFVGQQVRTKRLLQGSVKKPGVGGYWSQDIFTVAQRINSTYPNFVQSYKLKDANGKPVLNRFPKSSLLVVPPLLSKDVTPNEMDDSEAEDNNVADVPNSAVQNTPEPEQEPEDSGPRRSLRVRNQQSGEGDEYEIDYIVGKKGKGKRLQYKVHYTGYDRSFDQYRPASEVVQSAPEAVANYNRLHPN